MNQRISYIFWAIIVGASQLFLNSSLALASEKANDWIPLVRGDSMGGWYVLIAGQAKNVDPNHVFDVKDGVVHAYKKTPSNETVALWRFHYREGLFPISSSA